MRRVHTLAVPVVNEPGELFRGADGAALAALGAKLAVERTLGSRLDEARNGAQSRVGGCRACALLAGLWEGHRYSWQQQPSGTKCLPLTMRLIAG